MNCLELFAGAGGAAIGIERAGFEHLALVEWDKDAHAHVGTSCKPLGSGLSTRCHYNPPHNPPRNMPRRGSRGRRRTRMPVREEQPMTLKIFGRFWERTN